MRVLRLFVTVRATFGIALRSLARNPFRAALLIVGIAIGITTVFCVVAMIMGLTKSFTDQIASLGANTYYVMSRPWVTNGDWWKYRNRPPMTKADIEALKREATFLTAVAPLSFGTTDVAYLGDTVQNVQIRGTTDEYADIANLVVEAGRFMTPLEVELDEPIVVIGSELKSNLFHGSDPIGQHLNVHSHRFRVIGVLKERGKQFGQSQDNVVIVPLTRFQRMFGIKRNLIVAAMAAPDHLQTAEEQIIEVLRRSRHLSAADQENFSVNRQEALMKMFQSQTAMLFGIAIGVAAITLLVGGIGVMNIMLVTVTERTREVGVRRALGARRNTILVQFLVESTFVTMLGGILGVAVGIGVAYVINLVSPVPAVTSPVVAAIGVVFSAAVGLIFGTWPAYRAAQLDPIESLRYE